MPQALLATVHILLPLEIQNETEAADAISDLLTERGIYEDAILDWSYPHRGGRYVYARPVEVPDDYDRDEANLSAIAGDDETDRLRDTLERLLKAAKAVLDATGGNPPDWLREELVALEAALLSRVEG